MPSARTIEARGPVGAVLRATLDGMSQQRAPSLSGVADPEACPAEPSQERRLEGILEEQGEVEATAAQCPHRLDKDRPAFLTAVGEHFIDESGRLKEAGGARRGEQDDVGGGERRAQTAERGRRHHRVPDPIRPAHQDATDWGLAGSHREE